MEKLYITEPNMSRKRMVNLKDLNVSPNVPPLIELRREGLFVDHAYYLDCMYDWVLGRDDYGATILVPLEKV